MMVPGEAFIFLYGPPGVGKSSVGALLAENLGVPFFDLDAEIEAQQGAKIEAIFAQEGEASFRRYEREALLRLLGGTPGIVALGGGALLDPENRRAAESAGLVVCLSAPMEILLERLQAEAKVRPLLGDDLSNRLVDLYAHRAAHYASFPVQVDTNGQPVAEIARRVRIRLGVFRIAGMGSGYDLRVAPGGLQALPDLLRHRGLREPVAVVSDENVAALYASPLIAALRGAGYDSHLVSIPAGEKNKNIHTVIRLWEEFVRLGLERGSTVVALGGGVVSDLAGFAAATFLRGVNWVAVPTSLLAMVDASLGGKTGVDLELGKNLVGALHPPALVLCDPRTLSTLPLDEFRSGMAEVIKAGVIADEGLFSLCAQGWDGVKHHLEEVVCRAIAVKVHLVQVDPYERGPRAALNLGHTFGHALEAASGYRLRHGEAVSIGMVTAARLAEALGLAQNGLANDIAGALRAFGLPTETPPELDRVTIFEGMQRDKKRSGGMVRFVLPVRIGEVRTGIMVPDLDLVRELL